jgi:Rieske Fe-S protein
MSDVRPSRRDFIGQSSACLVLMLGSMPLVAAGRAAQGSITGEDRGGDERSYPVPAVDGVMVDWQAQVLLARYQDEIFALSLACPHEHAAVRWTPRAGRFQCSKHDSRYAPDGRYISGRSTRNLDRFPIRRDGAAVLVDVTRVWQADVNAAEWAAAIVPAC